MNSTTLIGIPNLGLNSFHRLLLSLILLNFLLGSCQAIETEKPTEEDFISQETETVKGDPTTQMTAEVNDGYIYEVPEELKDGWSTDHLEGVGIEETYLNQLMQDLEVLDGHRLHSLLIVKDGKLVFEEYFPGVKFNLAQFTGEIGFDRDDTHNLCSVTKSFTSAILGIVIDQGHIQSVQEKVIDFFPEYSHLIFSREKANLTLEQLLTMTSGIDWDDETTSYFEASNDMYQMFTSTDPIEYILSHKITKTPGTVFEYSNCNTNLLGEIVRSATGFRIDEFANIHLFSKLGIDDLEWQMLPDDTVFTSGDLRLRPRDMAKFGYLFLNNGEWNGHQVISKEWVERSTAKHVDLSGQVPWADGYGYQWWIWDDIRGLDYHAYFASGWGGQSIIILPEINTIVVSTAGNYYSTEQISIETILAIYILPAIVSE
jgi:CubicO group peptidase (beta-lactamase class C family)